MILTIPVAIRLYLPIHGGHVYQRLNLHDSICTPPWSLSQFFINLDKLQILVFNLLKSFENRTVI